MQQNKSWGWSPQIGLHYYTIEEDLDSVIGFEWTGHDYDWRKYHTGNCFPSEQAANKVLKRIRAIVVDAHSRIQGGQYVN
ncbi:MAG: hypothetical protein HQM16_17630 [Deltaproteobacteria bacterium]|nr:hypothetical protein [Deltaproteobacteria bacterium]